MKKYKFVYICLGVFLGMCVGFFAILRWFYIFPSEWKRYYHIKQNLQNENIEKPSIVFLGNSVVMNGVDAKTLGFSLKTKATIWNLSTPGQSIVESFVLAGETLPLVRHIIVGISCDNLYRKLTKRNRLSQMKLYDYNISSDILNILEKIDEKSFFNILSSPKYYDVLEGRNIIKNSIDFSIRNLLRKDLKLEYSQRDMFYPYTYTKPLNGKVLNKLLKKHYKHLRKSFSLDKESKILLLGMATYAREHNAKFTLLILPEHPYLIAKTSEKFYREMHNELASIGIHTWDYSRLLSEDLFIDHIHPTQEGAKSITQNLAQDLQR